MCLIIGALFSVLGLVSSQAHVPADVIFRAVGATSEGCVAVLGAPCTYIATKPGGIDGNGRWTVEIVRNGESRTYFGSLEPYRVANAIRAGDRVTAKAYLSCFCLIVPVILGAGTVRVGPAAVNA